MIQCTVEEQLRLSQIALHFTDKAEVAGHIESVCTFSALDLVNNQQALIQNLLGFG